MSLSQKIVAEVNSLAETHAPRGAVTVEDGPHQLTVVVGVAGPAGIEAEGLEFSARDRLEWSIADLQSWGARLAARLTYLMEPLRVVEADPIGVEVALRSQSPTPRGDRRSYYEVRLNRDGALRLDRMAFDATTRRRRPTPFQMTLEVLERLTDDLVTTALEDAS